MRGSPLPDPAEIEESANEFRRRYAAGTMGPLNIERIVEKELRIRLIPTPNLCRKAKSKGLVSHRGKAICIDANIYKTQPEEARQVITHETGHIFRHSHLSRVEFTTIDEVKAFHRNMSAAKLACIEYEAERWAGRVLMPRNQLDAAFKNAVTEVAELFGGAWRGHGVDVLRVARGLVPELVGDRFGVTRSWAGALIHKDGLWKLVHANKHTIVVGEPTTRRRKQPM
jgi:Zn-dependent peptidase ImmA (M78 family)